MFLLSINKKYFKKFKIIKKKINSLKEFKKKRLFDFV